MKHSSKVMYAFGKVFSLILLAIALTLIAVFSTLMTIKLINGEGLHYLSEVIRGSVWLVFILVAIFMTPNTLKAIEENERDNTSHIVMIVFGALSSNIFFVLGGIFGIIAVAQTNRNIVENKEETKDDNKAE